MDSSKLEMFVRVSQLKNITDAAQSLGYTQSGASHLLKTLERELGGIVLFTRNRTGVQLTSAGEKLLPIAHEILHWHRQLEQTASFLLGSDTGLLRLGGFTSSMTLWLPAILKTFHQQHPNLQLETMRGSYADVEQWVSTGEVDCGFCRLPVRRKLDSYFLTEDPLVALLPINHPLCEQDELTYQDLLQYDFIRPTRDRFNDIAPYFDKAGVSFRFPHVVHDYHEVISSVANGLGVSIVPHMMVQMYSFSVCTRPLSDRPSRRLGLVVNNEKKLSPLAIAFVQLTRNLFEEKLLP